MSEFRGNAQFFRIGHMLSMMEVFIRKGMSHRMYWHYQPGYYVYPVAHSTNAQQYGQFHHASPSQGRYPQQGTGHYRPQVQVVDMEDVTKRNDAYRRVIWTGEHLQVTAMSINVGDDIGLEIHPDNDQFIQIEQGEGLVRTGMTSQALSNQQRLNDDSAIMIPAGTWHNIINTGNRPLKLYSIYAPPHHAAGVVEQTKADAEAHE